MRVMPAATAGRGSARCCPGSAPGPVDAAYRDLTGHPPARLSGPRPLAGVKTGRRSRSGHHLWSSTPCRPGRSGR